MAALNSFPVTLPRVVGMRGRKLVFASSAQEWMTLGYALEDWTTLEFRQRFPHELVKGLRAIYGHPPRRHFRVTVAEYERLLAAGCAERGISFHHALSGRKRDASRVRMRVWRALNNQGMSLPAIGALADRDHSTILSGIRRVDFEDGKGPRPLHPSLRRGIANAMD